MPRIDRCDVKGCPIELGDSSGFEVRIGAHVVDRKDRDADAHSVELRACSHGHLEALLGAPFAELATRFSDAGKKKRRGGSK